MEVNFIQTDTVGVVKDQISTELPLAAFTDARNMKFVDGAVERMAGETAVFNPPTVAPYFLMPVRNSSNYFWVYAGLAKIYCHNGTAHFDLTRTVGGDYSASLTAPWSGGVLNGVGILNNANDVPQMWNTPATGTPFAALSNWPASTFCRSLRPFKNFLVALDVSKSGTRYPHLVKWSDAADPGLVPSTWDETDATKRAGEYPLAETDDYCIDSASLRDLHVIYKQESTWGMQLIGGAQVFRFFKMFDTGGALGLNCAAQIRRGYHAVFGPDDIVLHDGQSAQSIVDKRMRKYIYNRISGTNSAQAFVVNNPRQKQVWFCYPTGVNTIPNEAVVWDQVTNAFTIRELAGVAHAVSGIVNLSATPGGTTWAADTETWEEDTTTWDQSNFAQATRDVLQAEPTTPALLQADVGSTFNGSAITAYVAKKGIAIPHRNVNQPPDTSSVKTCTRIWPRIQGTEGGVINVYMGAHEEIQDEPSYTLIGTYTIGSNAPIDGPTPEGRLLAIKFESTTNISWRLTGFTLDLKSLGMY